MGLAELVCVIASTPAEVLDLRNLFNNRRGEKRLPEEVARVARIRFYRLQPSCEIVSIRGVIRKIIRLWPHQSRRMSLLVVGNDSRASGADAIHALSVRDVKAEENHLAAGFLKYVLKPAVKVQTFGEVKCVDFTEQD